MSGQQQAILILGGTAEARELAGQLAGQPGLRVISSLAGRVRDPALPAGEVRTGGFGGAEGLASWLAARDVTAVIDATHPFARGISANAAAACARTGTPLVSLVRPAWVQRDGDTWHGASSVADAARLLPGLGRRAFLTTGRQELAVFAPMDQLWFLIRCVDPPSGPLPAAREVILDRGSCDAAAEAALIREHAIDVLVTKNSGGELTAGKLAAARELRIPVVMVARPPLPQDVPRCETVAGAQSWLAHQFGRNGAE
jgi:precorrin-6A/cobalt-precorrin-6A reductase